MSTLSEYIIDLEEFDETLEYDPFVNRKVMNTEEIKQDDK
ncbi:15404_t:CDS:2 [Funneliformis caledonium]|uniref:15404_t:CDS:1 n=1 Tax=Funneliformis caledonium TaxID=1117310 RepID=A0A9N8WSE4_9GLOM|nr:15404_t:CDS:2 [Funneliformis caledonium]